MSVAEVPEDLPDYSRNDWRHWVDEDGDCLDTRNEVLLEESLAAVTYRSEGRCRVASGQWLAPYSGAVVTDPWRSGHRPHGPPGQRPPEWSMAVVS